MAISVLVVDREQMTCEWTHAIADLTALVRTVELDECAKMVGIQSNQGDLNMADSVRGRHHCDVPAEAVRLAKRIRTLDLALIDNRRCLGELVEINAPELTASVGVDAGRCSDCPDRVVTCRSGALRAAFASLAGTCPVPAS